MNPEQDIQKILSKARIGLLENTEAVFFSTLCISLETEITTDVSTAATDGFKLYINPAFFIGLSQEERVFVLAHETLHVAYLHALRKGSRDHQIFNAAADYVINLELKQHGFKLIPNVLYDRQYEDMSTEEVYEKLIQNAVKIELPMDDLLEPKSGDGNQIGNSQAAQEAAAKAEQEVQAKISRAAMLAEMSNKAGSIPASIQRHLKDLTKPKVNWKIVLQRFFSEMTASDYSWKRPNRKHFPTYLPRLVSKTLGRIDFAIDTSGSINEEQFNQFVSEVHSVLRMLNPSEIGVYQFDSILQGSDVVKNIHDILKLPFSGGGGTNPQPAIDEFQKHNAKALVILTDGHFYKKLVTDPKRPVIWVVYDNEKFTPPFGKAIHFNLRKL